VEEGAKSLRRQSLQVLLNGKDLCWVMVITVIESVHGPKSVSQNADSACLTVYAQSAFCDTCYWMMMSYMACWVMVITGTVQVGSDQPVGHGLLHWQFTSTVDIQ
jgi:hypothetical protein